MNRTTIDLDIGGMTCASCAARIEKRLSKLDGVEAEVNYATEKAYVSVPEGTDPQTLIDEVEKTGYTASLPAPPEAAAQPAESAADAELRALRQRLFGSLWLAVPVIIVSMVPALQFDYWQWAALTLTAPVITWGAWPFHRAAWINLRHGAVTMDTLVSLGTGSAFLWSLYALFFGTAGERGMRHAFEFTVHAHSGAGNIYLEVAAGVTVFLLAGRTFEHQSKRRAGEALTALLKLGAKEATVLRDGTEVRVPIASLRVGDEFVTRPGERIATDGTVVSGSTAVDRSMVTGESVPEEAGPGSRVIGGTVVTGGRIVVRATEVGADTQLARMAKLVEEAQQGKAEVQRLADRISAVFVPIVIVISIVTLIAWIALGGGVASAFTAAVAVLIIACPCALGLATPTALLVGTGRGAQLGILIRGPEVLESTRRVDTVVLDKTGTVTEGRMVLAEVVAAAGQDEAEVLRLAGALEHASEHPIGQAIARAAAERSADPLPGVESFRADPGRGVTGVVEGHAVMVGSARLLEQWAVAPDPALQERADALQAEGQTVVVAAWDGEVRGLLAVADAVKSSSPEAIAAMTRLGLETVLLTGDQEAVAQHVARQVGITRVHAGTLPEQKVERIRALQAEGRVVAMIGDGVNDAPALAQADLGIAMGGGTDAAISAADITLVRDDLRSAVDAIRLSRRTLGTIKGNLFWAFAYNVAAIPLAALGLLNPMIAGAAMAFSSAFVVGNSLTLRRFRGIAPTPNRESHRESTAI